MANLSDILGQNFNGYTGSRGFTGSQGMPGPPANQSLDTTNNVRFSSLGVNTAPSGVAGEIRATGDITAFFSDDRLKNRLGSIENALEKITLIQGFYYEPNELARELGYVDIETQVGVSAQDVQRVLPEIVVPAPISNEYLTVKYEKLAPLIIEAIKELNEEVKTLKKSIEEIKAGK